MLHSSQSRLKTVSVILLCLIFLTACGCDRQPPTDLPPTIHPATPMPTASRTLALNPSLLLTQTLEPSVEPTNTPVPVTTPQGSAENYRLKSWDYSTALRVYSEASDVPIAEEYNNLRSFYQVSLLEELYLSFPNLRSDPNLMRDLANFKGLGETYWATYGLLHDHSVEPFRQGLENALNNSSAKLPELNLWGATINIENEYSSVIKTTNLFEESTPATVQKVSAVMGWDFFVVRENADGSYAVFALYPEWKRNWWNDETFQITDLNGNGREEITITYEGWGSGFTHFCEEELFVYEWDGQTFHNLISTPLNVFANTDYGNCLGFSFNPDTAGRKLIRTGISKGNYCDDFLYMEPLSYRWNGEGFVPLAKSIPVPPSERKPDICTIDWALAAGMNNDSALKLLAAAVTDWPEDAEEVWGPAAHDYFKMKLATWYLGRGQVQRGIDLLTQLRDAPAAPDFQFASQIATIFLETYETKGIYQAVSAVDSFYEKAEESVCSIAWCDTEEMRKQWGFAEPLWGEFGYRSQFDGDFQSIDALSLDLNRNPLASLEDFQNRLKEIGLIPAWVGEADADGQGQLDWLVDLNSSQILFLRNNGRITRVNLDSIYEYGEGENRTHRWHTFQTSPKAPVINIYQVGTEIFAFHLLQDKGPYQVVFDLDSSEYSLTYNSDRVEVREWLVQEGKLIVQYDGSEGVYIWDDAAGRLAPIGYSPELVEENISQAERAIYIEDDPSQAIEILTNLLKGRVVENYAWAWYEGYTNPPRVRPYAEYLLGLAYERAGNPDNAAQAYWQLWRDFPSSPYSLAAQRKLEIK